MRKSVFVSLFLAVYTTAIVAQQQSPESNRVIQPSPTAASLGKYGNFPVSLYTGQVDIDIPLLSVTSGKLNLPVTLSYNSTGNKPSDIPGWVGLGWNILAGGVITRSINDLPDDYPGGYYYIHNDIKAQLQLEEAGNPSPLLYQDYINRVRDVKPDEYQFNFNGHTGKFLIDLDGNIQFRANEKFLIEVHTFMGYFDYFIITATDGKKYTFSAKEWGATGPGAAPGFGKYVTSWYLTKIEDVNGDEMTFNYTAANQKYRFKEHIFQKSIFIADNINESYLSSSFTMDEVIYLSEINFSNGKVKFNTSVRNDLLYQPSYWSTLQAEERKLDEIVLMNTTGAVQKKWLFAYIESPDSRLKLQSLREVDANGTLSEPYVFGYHPVSLPGAGVIGGNPYSSNAVDYWGYYNAAANSGGRIPFSYLPGSTTTVGDAERTANAETVKAEMLTRIVYPTKGYTDFEYESNDYSYTVKSDGLVPVPPFGYVWEQKGFFYEDRVFDVDPNTITFTLTEVSDVFIHKASINIGPNKAWCPTGLNEFYWTLQPGTYTLAYVLSTEQLLNPGSSDIQTAEGYVRIRRKVPIPNPLGGGVRIKSVKNHDGVRVTTKRYEYKMEGSETQSSGVLNTTMLNAVYLNQYWIGLSGTWLSSESLYPAAEGPVVGYSFVKEIFEDGSGIAHRFNNYQSATDGISLAFHFIQHDLIPLTSRDYWRGLETNIKYFNADKTVFKEIVNAYEVDAASEVDIPVLEYKIVFKYDPTAGFPNPGGFNLNGTAILASKYLIPCRFVYLKNSTEIVYNIEGQMPALVNETITFHENPDHFLPTKIRTVNSKKQTVEKILHYPAEMVRDGKDPNGIYQAMIAKNKIDVKVEEIEVINGTQVDLSRTGYFQPHPGLFVPHTIEKQKGSTDPILTRFKYLQYDVHGNILEQAKVNDVSRSYIWGYNNTYPVAEVTGASYDEVMDLLDPGILQNPPNDQTLRDELQKIRTAFPSALVITYTHRPFIGMTSETDAAGRTTFYQYDGFGKLTVVKDQDGNILRTIKYNFKQ